MPKRKNILESDGTLILNKGFLSEGSKLALDFVIQYGKPILNVQLGAELPFPSIELEITF